jgi:hypothetical protein
MAVDVAIADRRIVASDRLDVVGARVEVDDQRRRVVAKVEGDADGAGDRVGERLRDGKGQVVAKVGDGGGAAHRHLERDAGRGRGCLGRRRRRERHEHSHQGGNAHAETVPGDGAGVH